MTSRIQRIILVALIVLGVAACGGDDDSGADNGVTATSAPDAAAEITVQTFNFQPDPLTVEAGTTVTFRNMDKINHSVTPGTRDEPTPDAFEEGVMEQAGDTYELTLDEPGTYDYFCKFHPGEGMTGQIIVT